MKNILLILFSISFFITKGSTIDSLTNVIENKENDSIKFETYSKLINQYLNIDPAIAEELSLKQISLSKTKTDKANSFLNLALSQDYQYKFDSAISNYHKAYNFFELNNDTVGLSRVLLNLGIVNYYKGDIDSSIFFYVKTLDYAEKIGQKRLVSSAYSNLGTIHRELGEYKISLKYHNKSLQIEEEFDNTDGKASSYNNIALCYRGLKQYDTALEYYGKCLELRKELNDEVGLAIVYTNIGQLHFYKKDFQNALMYNLKSLEIELKFENEIGIAESNVNIGDCYYELGDVNKAIEYLEKSLETSEKFELPDLMLASLEGLSTAYASLGNYQKAYSLNYKYSTLQDSLFNETRMKQVKELEAKFNADQAESENELLKKENLINSLELSQKEVVERNFYIGFGLLLLILVLVFYAYNSNKNSSKKLTLRNHKIELMNKDLSIKNKEITDSIVYAKRIQEAILPQDKFFKQCLENSFILYKPKDIVSGDFYWMEQVGDEILFATVDCTGHGVPGAFMSIVGNNGLNRAVREYKSTNPASILDILNQYVMSSIQKHKSEVKDGMDIALCNLNIKSNVLKFSGANNPFYLIRNGELKVYKGTNQPIGDVRKQFKQEEIQLLKGDTCYIFTDGYADQFGGEKGKKFNLKRFKNTILDIHVHPIESQRDLLERIFENWKGNEEQLDDICIIGFRI